jgi:hypothetical protein
MDSSLLASVLSQLAGGARAELAPDEVDALRYAVSAGLAAATSADPGAAEALARLRTELAAARGTPREGALRTEILALSDRLAESSGGVELAARASGMYRGSAEPLGTFHLTHAGRALLGDLGPRADRVRGMRHDEFVPAIAVLRSQIEARAARAGAIRNMLGDREPVGAMRLATLGVASRREEHTDLAQRLAETMAFAASTSLTPAERWSAAESAVLAAGSIEDAAAVLRQLVALRDRIFAQFSNGLSEDALDAAVLLLPWPEHERNAAIARAAELATHFRSATNTALPLSLALVLERARPGAELSADRLVAQFAALAPEPRGTPGQPVADDTAAAAVLLSLADADPELLARRARSLLDYVSRFSPTPLWSAAAALALLDGDVGAIVDDLRLTSAATQRFLGASSGAEAIGLAIKLLLLVATLGLGADGDPEEYVALRPRIAPSVRRLGLAGLATSLPSGLPLGAAFHAPLLTAHDVALAAAPMHDSYVFGSSGWGSSGWGNSGWGNSGWGNSGWGSRGSRGWSGSRGWG